LVSIEFKNYYPEAEKAYYPEYERIHKRKQKHHEKVWEALVDKYAETMLIEDKKLAHRVVVALEKSSSEFNVDPWLVAALIRVESAGNPDAVSNVGAIGLTQIMPETGRDIANVLNIDNFSVSMLYNPEINVRMGTYYISWLLNKFNGDMNKAIAAYNWGPGHIERRMEKNEPMPRQYTQKVIKIYKNKI